MNKTIKGFILLLLSIQTAIVVIEILFCIYTLLIDRTGCNFLDNFISTNDIRLDFSYILLRQLSKCLLVLGKIFVHYFIVVFIDCIDYTQKQEIERDDFLINYDGDLISSDLSKPNNEPQINIETTDKNVDETYLKGLYSLSFKIIYYLDTEDNIILFLSYLYIFTTYSKYLISYITLPPIILFPYIFKKTNMKLYMRYKHVKPLIYCLYSSTFLLSLDVVNHLTKKMKYIDNDFLPKDVNEYLTKEGFIVYSTMEESHSFSITVFKIPKIIYIHITKYFKELSEEEQIPLIYKEIGKNFTEGLFYRVLLNFLEVACEIFILQMGKGLFVKIFSRFGEFFIVYLLLQISLVPFLRLISHFYSHYFGIQSDSFSLSKSNYKDLSYALCKQFFCNKIYFNKHSF